MGSGEVVVVEVVVMTGVTGVERVELTTDGPGLDLVLLCVGPEDRVIPLFSNMRPKIASVRAAKSLGHIFFGNVVLNSNISTIFLF